MTSIGSNLDKVLVTERELWIDGPPHELFKELRSECPVHWTEQITEYPDEAGFWSVTTADDIHAVSRDWQTYSSERGGITAVTERLPARARAGDVHRHGPAQARPHQGAVPGRLHAEADRRPRGRDPRDRRSTCSTGSRAARPATSSPTSPSRWSRA